MELKCNHINDLIIIRFNHNKYGLNGSALDDVGLCCGMRADIFIKFLCKVYWDVVHKIMYSLHISLVTRSSVIVWMLLRNVPTSYSGYSSQLSEYDNLISWTGSCLSSFFNNSSLVWRKYFVCSCEESPSASEYKVWHILAA